MSWVRIPLGTLKELIFGSALFCDIARTLMTQKADGDDVGAGDMKTAGLRKGDPTDHK